MLRKLCEQAGRFPRSSAMRLAWQVALGVVAVLSCPQARAQVVINEILAVNTFTNLDDEGDSSDWVELLNLGSEAVDLEGFSISDNSDEPERWILPALVVEAGGYALVWCSGKDRRAVAPDVVLARNSNVPVRPRWIAADAEWQYLAGPPEEIAPALDWEVPEFDASAWPSGATPLGFGVADLATELPAGTGNVFLRHEFNVTDPGAIASLILQVHFDDGIRVYLNGTEVLSVNAPEGELTFATHSTRAHAPVTRERYELVPWRDLLVPGTNLLSVALLNIRPNSNDLLLQLELGETETVLHTDFKLRSSGETLTLSAPDGTIIDGVVFPEQTADQSFARSPDGTGPFLYHLEPTPLAANTGPAASEPLTTEVPHFSVERGYYTEPFQLELTPPVGASVHVTLDGSAPSVTAGEPYSGPLRIDATTTVRAISFREGAQPSAVATHSYLFLEDVIEQREFKTEFTQDSTQRPRVERALSAVPALILSSSEPVTATETEVSVELLAGDGEDGFQLDAGARYVGGHSLGAYPKKMIRLYFRSRYSGDLVYPLFEEVPYGTSATDRFEQLQLHSGAHDSVFYLGDLQQSPSNAQYLRNVWMSDAQFEMGHLSLHTRFLHVYLNGRYWGHYHATERPTPSFFASYLGGDVERYEATNSGRETVGGPTPAWEAIQSARGNYAELSRYLDMENYVDYLLLQFYGGNAWDWSPNQNWMAGGPSAPDSGGCKLICWDSDIIFRDTLDRNIERGGPENLLPTLRSLPEFRALVTDRAREHFFNGGVLTPERTAERYRLRADEIGRSLPTEPARWQWNRRWTLEDQWQTEKERLFGDFFPRRTEIVLDQLLDAQLYPTIRAPWTQPDGGLLEPGEHIFVAAEADTLYYTLDGADPRAPDGSVHSSARVYEVPRRTLLEPLASARIRVPTDDSLGLDWIQPDFDDTEWLDGPAAVGFERTTGYEDLIATDLGEQMHRQYTSAYVRIPFELADPTTVLGFLALLRYDDGVVIYLNGVPVLSRNTPAEPMWDSKAPINRADSLALAPETLSFAAAELPLRVGPNVLAVHVLNRISSDQDLLFHLELSAIEKAAEPLTFEETTVLQARVLNDEGEWSAMSAARFVVGASLVISEIMYHPGASDEVTQEGESNGNGDRETGDFEFLEIRNVSDRSFDLAGVHLQVGVTFSFDDSPIRTIPPGGTVVVVADEDAFSLRYPTVPGRVVAGQFAGKLNNAGELLTLVGNDGNVLFEVTYDDSWYDRSDGRGHSLVLFDEERPPLDPEAKKSWRASRSVGGSPGTLEQVLDGLRLPGDVDQNGRLNLADPLTLLRRLFATEAVELPCGDSLTSPGNQTLLDVNADGAVNIGDVTYELQYLFQRGAPPASGTNCRTIPGCTDSCD